MTELEKKRDQLLMAAAIVTPGLLQAYGPDELSAAAKRSVLFAQFLIVEVMQIYPEPGASLPPSSWTPEQQSTGKEDRAGLIPTANK